MRAQTSSLSNLKSCILLYSIEFYFQSMISFLLVIIFEFERNVTFFLNKQNFYLNKINYSFTQKLITYF